MAIGRRRALGVLGGGLLATGLFGGRVARSQPELVEAAFDAAVRPVRLLGRRVPMWVYGGGFPGPLLELAEGETLRLRFTNRLPHPTNLHFHGMHIPPTGRADNIYIRIPPGERFTYEFTPGAGSAGTYWYHPHIHELVARQMWFGLAGPIVVRGPLDAMPELAAADERVVLLRDVALEGEGLAAFTVNDWHKGKEGPHLLANGEYEPEWRMRSGTARLRLVNVANARHLRLALSDRRPMFLIALDGQFLERPVDLEELLLAPAQRAEVLVRFEDGRPIELLAPHYNRGAPTPRLRNRFVLHMRPPPGASPLPLPQRLATVPELDPADARVRRRIDLSMFLVNGRRYRYERVDIRGRLGDLELWRVRNLGTMDHPFHLHTWPFQIHRLNGRRPSFRAWYDTLPLRPGDEAELLVPLRSFAGRTLFHCHIAEHADRGMMGTIEVVPEGDRLDPLPPPVPFAPEGDLVPRLP